MSTPELVALMLADGRLPTGGHTQSAGLEPAVRAGLGADGNELGDVAAYARDRLRTVTRTEAAVAVVTRHLVLTSTTTPCPPSRSLQHELSREIVAADSPATPSRGDRSSPAPPIRESWLASPDQDPRLGDAAAARGASRGVRVAEQAWAARTPSQVVRAVSRRQGRLFLRLAGRVWPGVLRHLPPDAEIARPVVLGVVGAVTSLSAEQLARIVAYDDAQTVVSASLKLLPVDPADAANWLARLHDDIERLVTDVAPLTEIDKLPAAGAPLLDVFAHQHATERMRLFHA